MNQSHLKVMNNIIKDVWRTEKEVKKQLKALNVGVV